MNSNNQNNYNGGYNPNDYKVPNGYGNQGYNQRQQYNQGYNPYGQQNNYPSYAQRSYSVEQLVADTMKKVYLRMCLALVVTGIVSWAMVSNPHLIASLFSNSIVFWGIIIAQFAIVLFIDAAIRKIGNAAGTALFLLYSVLMGLWIAPLLYMYTTESIASTFFITAGTFGAMSAYGYVTNQDLTKVGSFLFFALIGLIIASIVNIFLHSTPLMWIISIAGVLIFLGLTAWDTQKIKQWAAMATTPQEQGRLATIGALSLYLDFVNLFLYLLRFFGRRN